MATGQRKNDEQIRITNVLIFYKNESSVNYRIDRNLAVIQTLIALQKTFKYNNEDITVVWKPDTCIHSTLCWKGLIGVFNPKEKPWIRMENASTEKIIEQVRKCPSGALSYFVNEEANGTGPDKIAAESATILKIEVSANGPYLVKTECLIVHQDGREEKKSGTVALCRCGGSANKPYCDGSHRKIGFSG